MSTLRLSVLLLGVIVAIFSPSLWAPFVHDDRVFILQNSQIHRLDLAAILTSTSHQEGILNSYYRPMLELYYRLMYAGFGFNPIFYHGFNILLHAVNAVLVWRLLLAVGFSVNIALMVALIFGIHPVQVEAVSCISGISNILMGFFLLAGLNLYLKRYILLAGISFILAMFAKESAVVFPMVIVLIDVYRHQRPVSRWLLWIFTVGVFLWWRQQMVGGSLWQALTINPQELLLRVMHIPNSIITYMSVILLPFDLHYYRNLDVLKPWWPGWLMLSIFLIFIAGLGHLIQAKRIFRFSLLWFLILLMPMLNIIPLINEYSLILNAEHFVYLSMIGIVLVALYLVKDLFISVRHKIIALIMLLILSALNVYQQQFWQSEIRLFERMLKYESTFGRGHILLAKAYMEHQQWEKALNHFDQAINIFNQYYQQTVNPKAKSFYQGLIKGAYFDKANVLMAQGDFPKASQLLALAMRLDPHDQVLELNFAVTLMQMGEWDHALSHLNRLIDQGTQDPKVFNNKAICLISLGQSEEARIIWQEMLKNFPDFQPAKDNLARLGVS